MRALRKEASTRVKGLEEEKDRVSQELIQKVQELERSAAIHEKDRGALARRDHAIIRSAVKRANLVVGTLQAATGIVILLLAGSVLMSLIVENPPWYVKAGATVFALIAS